MNKRKAKTSDMLRTVRAKAQRFVDRLNWAEARPLLQQAATLYEQLEAETGDAASFALERAMALLFLASALEDANDVPGAIAQAKRAIVVLKKVPDSDAMGRNRLLAAVLTRLGRWQMLVRSPKRAERTLSKAVALYRAMPDDDKCMDELEFALALLSCAYANCKNVEKCACVFNEAHDLREKLALSDPDRYVGRMVGSLRWALHFATERGAHEHAVGFASKFFALLKRYAKDYYEVFPPSVRHEFRAYITGPELRSAIRKRPRLGALVPWSSVCGLDWVDLVLEDHIYDAYCQWDALDANKWGRILSKRPELMKRCDWGMVLEVEKKGTLEALHQEYAENKGHGLLPRANMSESEYVFRELASRAGCVKRKDFKDRKQYVEACLNECARSAYASAWVDILQHQPHFADQCDLDWLDSDNWSSLLCARPEFADRCKWEGFPVESICRLLRKRPEFSDRFDLSLLRGEDWVDLLLSRGKIFIPKCDWRKLTKEDWKQLLSKRPSLAGMRQFGRYKGPRPKHLKCK